MDDETWREWYVYPNLFSEHTFVVDEKKQLQRVYEYYKSHLHAEVLVVTTQV